MSVHIGELDSSVELAPEAGTAGTRRARRSDEPGCPVRAAEELLRQLEIDRARTRAEGYVD